MKTYALSLLLLMALCAGCSTKENVDVVKGVTPISTAFASIAHANDTMASMTIGERGAYLEETWPHLDEDLAYFLRRHGKLNSHDHIDRIEFYYGSMEDVQAESATGNRYGYFKNQLIAMVWLVDTKDPVKVIVECLNGTFAMAEDIQKLQQVGSHTPLESFTIARNEGLLHHVDYPVAMDLADRFDLPLYRGKVVAEENRISVAEARELEATTDRLQVTVLVYEGDVFDLRRMTFKSPHRHIVEG